MRRSDGWRVRLLLVCSLVVTGCAQTRQFVENQNPLTRAKRQFEVKFDLAQVAEREGQLRKAADQYAALLEKQPQNAQLHHRLGVVKVRLGERDEGMEHLRRAHDLKPGDPAILNDLGFACLEMGELDEAENYLREALSINANDRRTINNLGLCAAQSGRIDEAFRYFRRVGGEAEAHANLGYILAQMGDIEAAMQHYHQALSLDPQMRSAAEALIQLSRLSGGPAEPKSYVAKQGGGQRVAVQQASAELDPEEETLETSIEVQKFEQPLLHSEEFGLSAPSSGAPQRAR